jgi:FkbM family methyltransferase
MLTATTAYGLKFFVATNDLGVGKVLRERGEFARVETDLIVDYLSVAPKGTYIDVGANIGAIALPVAAATKARVIAIEAQREVASILAANVCNNGLHRIEVIHAAAGAQVGLTRFPQARLGKQALNFGIVGDSLAGHEDLHMETVRVCTLDEVAPADTRLVKIDVEGGEPQVLAGAADLIAKIRPIWLLEANDATMETARLTMATLLQAGYRLFWLHVPLATPQAERPGPRSVAGDSNFVALPEGVGNLWDLPPILSPDAERPSRAQAFGYLNRYGYRFAPLPA